jgi:hypothetical protein
MESLPPAPGALSRKAPIVKRMPGRSGNSQDPDTEPARAEAKLLATVLELTLVVAQTGIKVVPPYEAPAALRPEPWP